MLIDSHHHLWQVARGDYGWLDSRINPSVAALERDFLLSDYQILAARNGIEGSVAVQAAETVAETRWLLAQAHASGGLIKGVVGWIDMAADRAVAQLRAMAADPLLKGIRPMLQDLAEVDWVLRRELDPAFRAIIECDLVFDILIRPPQVSTALELLLRYPDLRAVVDHCAKPDIANQMWQPWADQMRRIARETSAVCKLSGLVTEASHDWRLDHLRPYVEHVIDCFGPQRVMWGSDWPVMTLNADFESWLDVAQRLLAPLAKPDRDAVLGTNAIRTYRLRSADRAIGKFSG